jgi:hypothetical protein
MVINCAACKLFFDRQPLLECSINCRLQQQHHCALIAELWSSFNNCSVAASCATHLLLVCVCIDTLSEGENGLGKTTFIKNLTSSFTVTKAPADSKDVFTNLSTFIEEAESLKTVLEPMEIPESSRRLLVSFQVWHLHLV